MKLKEGGNMLGARIRDIEKRTQWSRTMVKSVVININRDECLSLKLKPKPTVKSRVRKTQLSNSSK